MKKSIISINLLGCMLCSQVAYAAVTIDYYGTGGGNGSRDVILSTGSVLPDGNEVRVGYFDTAFDIAGNRDNLSALGTAWHTFGTTPIVTDAGAGGLFSGSSSKTDNTFDGKKIYLWIFKTSANNAPVADYSNVQQHGIYTSSEATWLFPASDAIPPGNSRNLGAEQVNSFLVGNLSGSSLQLSVVPEPAGVGIAFALGAGIWAVLRRKNQK